MASQVALVINNLPANTGDLRYVGSIPGSGRSPGEGIPHSDHVILFRALPLSQNPLEEWRERTLLAQSIRIATQATRMAMKDEG